MWHQHNFFFSVARWHASTYKLSYRYLVEFLRYQVKVCFVAPAAYDYPVISIDWSFFEQSRAKDLKVIDVQPRLYNVFRRNSAVGLLKIPWLRSLFNGPILNYCSIEAQGMHNRNWLKLLHTWHTSHFPKRSLRTQTSQICRTKKMAQ